MIIRSSSIRSPARWPRRRNRKDTTVHTFAASCSLSPEQIANCQELFGSDPLNHVALNAVSSTELHTVALNRAAYNAIDHIYSHEIPTVKVTNQKRSGRCWMFAGLNTLRLRAIEKMNLEEFELSQNFCMFWDKFERSNYFLECVLRSLDEPMDSRLVQFLMQNPLVDGGQWDMFINLVSKYGVVPKSVMPETLNSSKTYFMNGVMYSKLREYACELRDLSKNGKNQEALRTRKEAMMRDVYRILAIHCGEPPREFIWQYRDKDKDFHRDNGVMTPQQFYDKYISLELDDYISLIHCPTPDKPLQQLYTLDYIGNVCEGRPILYLNVGIEIIKEVSIATLEEGEPVWFGADVRQFMHRGKGILDTNIYDYEKLFSTSFAMTKAQRVDYSHSASCHAMVLTGVNLDDDNRPTKWKVENSWGEDNGDKGYYVMTDDWFDEYLFQVVIAKKYLPSELLKVLEQKPVTLPPWDPMGVLALMQ